MVPKDVPMAIDFSSFVSHSHSFVAFTSSRYSIRRRLWNFPTSWIFAATIGLFMIILSHSLIRHLQVSRHHISSWHWFLVSFLLMFTSIVTSTFTSSGTGSPSYNMAMKKRWKDEMATCFCDFLPWHYVFRGFSSHLFTAFYTDSLHICSPKKCNTKKVQKSSPAEQLEYAAQLDVLTDGRVQEAWQTCGRFVKRRPAFCTKCHTMCKNE